MSKLPKEYRAWIPGDRDLYIAPHFSDWMTRARMEELLEHHSKVPGGNRGVKVYERPIVHGTRAKDFPIP